MSRRTEILDTALHVLAEHGMRGLTHRAVDRAARLPDGSTSYYFRTRDALVTGCVHRLLDLDRAELPERDLGPLDLDALTAMAVESCVAMVTTGSYRTRARYELSLHMLRTPQLRAELRAAGDRLRTLIANVLTALGVPDARPAAEELAAIMDGLVFTALVRGPHDPADLRARLRRPLHRALAAALPTPPAGF